MQRKLATWTLTYKTRRVNQLLRFISHPAWLQHAANITLSSVGAKTAGVDGMTKSHMLASLDIHLEDIRQALLSGDYQPMPAQLTREHMKQDMTDYMEYYIQECLHTASGNMSPIKYEISQKKVSG